MCPKRWVVVMWFCGVGVVAPVVASASPTLTTSNYYPPVNTDVTYNWAGFSTSAPAYSMKMYINGGLDWSAPPQASGSYHKFLTSGVFNFTLNMVDSGGGLVQSASMSVNAGGTPPAPTAAFTYTPASGLPPLAVTFTDTSTGTPTSWSWAFGDGSSPVTTQNASHTFAAAGTYTVTLTATNAQGSSSASHTVTVTGTTGPGSGPATGKSHVIVTVKHGGVAQVGYSVSIVGTTTYSGTSNAYGRYEVDVDAGTYSVTASGTATVSGVSYSDQNTKQVFAGGGTDQAVNFDFQNDGSDVAADPGASNLGVNMGGWFSALTSAVNAVKQQLIDSMTWLVDHIKTALQDLFVPDNTHLQALFAKFHDLIDWGPITLLTDVKDLYDGAGGSGGGDISFSLPGMSGGGFSAGVVPVNFHAMTDNSAWALCRELLGASVWLGFITWVRDMFMPRQVT